MCDLRFIVLIQASKNREIRKYYNRKLDYRKIIIIIYNILLYNYTHFIYVIYIVHMWFLLKITFLISYLSIWYLLTLWKPTVRRIKNRLAAPKFISCNVCDSRGDNYWCISMESMKNTMSRVYIERLISKFIYISKRVRAYDSRVSNLINSINNICFKVSKYKYNFTYFIKILMNKKW